MRVVGDWSYSLYLWHWPVLIIAERRVGALGFWRTALCLVVVFVLSALTYRYVEQPFRSPRRFPVRQALSLYPAAVAVVAAGSLSGYYYSEYSSGALGDNPAITLTNFGVKDESSYDLDKDPTVALVQASVIAARHHMAIPSKLEPDILTVRDDEPDLGDCNYEKDSRELCPRGDPDADRSIVVFGNSHARMWIPAFDEIGTELGYRTYYFVKPNCAASLVSVGELVPGSPLWPECDEFRDWALDQIAALDPDLVVVASSGPNPVLYDDEGNRIPKDGDRRRRPRGVRRPVHPALDHGPAHRPAPRRTEVRGAARRVPHQEGQRPRRLPVHARCPPPSSTPTSPEAAADETGTEVVDPTKWLCWDGSCPVGHRRRAALPRPRPPHHRLRGLAVRRADQGAGPVTGGIVAAFGRDTPLVTCRTSATTGPCWATWPSTSRARSARTQMYAEQAHNRCPSCLYIEPCCDGAPQPCRVPATAQGATTD